MLGLYRASLLGHGAFAWPDEQLYSDALQTVTALSHGDITRACTALTGFGARPAEATLRLIPAALQIWLERTQGISPYNPQSFLIPTSFNVIASLLLSLVFYRLSRRFLSDDRRAPLVATIVFSLLVSSNAFVRHVVPYDTALMFCLLSLLLGVQREPSGSAPVGVKRAALAVIVAGAGLFLYPVSFLLGREPAKIGALIALVAVLSGLAIVCRDEVAEGKHWALVGLVAGCGLAVYPAYYPFPVMVGAIIVLRTERAPYVALSMVRLRAGLVYGFAALSVMLFFEVIARVGDVSYLACAYRLSRTITQGSFEEGYIFLAKYFSEVEGVIGILILGGAAVYWILLARRLLQRVPVTAHASALALCCAVSAGLYLIYATQSTVLHRMTFTGRYARMYVPFVVWAAVAAIREIGTPRLRTLAYSAMLLACLVSFLMFERDYRALAYPVNVLYENGIRWEEVNPSSKVYESERIHQEWISTDFPKGLTREYNFVTRPNDDRFILLNFGYFVLEETRLPVFVPPENVHLIYRNPHFLTFRSSRFESFAIEKRAELVRRNYQIAIYGRTGY